jgi:integrase/recombinase XerD
VAQQTEGQEYPGERAEAGADALLAKPDRNTRKGQRDHAVLLFLYNSGARASERTNVAISDLERHSSGDGRVKLHGKGSKIRFCPLWSATMKELMLLVQDGPLPNRFSSITAVNH